jgi:hypothetical protein
VHHVGSRLCLPTVRHLPLGLGRGTRASSVRRRRRSSSRGERSRHPGSRRGGGFGSGELHPGKKRLQGVPIRRNRRHIATQLEEPGETFLPQRRHQDLIARRRRVRRARPHDVEEADGLTRDRRFVGVRGQIGLNNRRQTQLAAPKVHQIQVGPARSGQRNNRQITLSIVLFGPVTEKLATRMPVAPFTVQPVGTSFQRIPGRGGIWSGKDPAIEPCP